VFGPTTILTAVKGVSLSIASGETVALVGESGCGKSTLSKAIMGLLPIKSGMVELASAPFIGGTKRPDRAAMRQMRQQLQMVFQDPYGSFNPRQRVGHIIAEPFYLLNETLGKTQAVSRVADLLEAVGLSAADARKYPHEFSGGQRQRIAIARAMATSPEVILLDEAVSALDVTVRAQILDLLTDIQKRMGLAFLFISHDLSVVRGFAHRVLVMRAGQIIEEGETEQIFTAPSQHYTAELLSATPEMAFAL
jgi:peptide/nickel transport system ATP-binding protein